MQRKRQIDRDITLRDRLLQYAGGKVECCQNETTGFIILLDYLIINLKPLSLATYFQR